jgi:VIT1/CCC1 family predicted Fe2+/Mn2+ transporter
LREHGLNPRLAQTAAAAITSDPKRWINFMMRFELGLEEPEAGREFKSAMTISSAYIAGGLLPLAPYFLLGDVTRALPISASLTLAALLIFGGVKGQFAGVAPFRSALQTALVGTLAATAAFVIARLVSS